MNILFLTLLDFDNIEERNIYTDLLRKFYQKGHGVYVVSPVERKKHIPTRCIRVNKRLWIAKPKIGNIQKTNIIEKGISTVTLESKFISTIKKYYVNIKFDLVLYSTPPITLQKAVNFVKKRDGAITYLLLKDIFPQNAVDMGMLTKKGVRGVLYRYFRGKEKKLYRDSDYIGCMSEANCKYVIKHNPEVNPNTVEECPNCVDVQDLSLTQEEKNKVRKKYRIPLDKKVFVYGGNLGKPQGIPFIIECLKSQIQNDKVFFLIIGDGTEYGRLKEFFVNEKPTNMKLLKSLPKDAYDKVMAACDVGMIYLDYRFTIPNFPSRILSYMQAGLPIIACTDISSDIGKTIVDGGFGWWCKSNDLKGFLDIMQEAISNIGKSEIFMKERQMLDNKYSTDICYKIITCKKM